MKDCLECLIYLLNRKETQGVNGEVKSSKSMLIKTGYPNLLHGCDFLCLNLMNYEWVWEGNISLILVNTYWYIKSLLFMNTIFMSFTYSYLLYLFITLHFPVVLHCASLLHTIFASLACAHRRVHVQNVRDFPQSKRDREINSPFLLNEHGDPRFFFRNLLRTV